MARWLQQWWPGAVLMYVSEPARHGYLLRSTSEGLWGVGCLASLAEPRDGNHGRRASRGSGWLVLSNSPDRPPSMEFRGVKRMDFFALGQIAKKEASGRFSMFAPFVKVDTYSRSSAL